MNLLALETATHHLSVALYCDGVVSERAEKMINGGSEHLLPWATGLLRSADMTYADLDGIAFGSGPGGFTGLRLACGIAQGLAMGLSIPVVGISSLEALACAAYARGARYVMTCLDARMNEVYSAAWIFQGGVPDAVMPLTVATVENFPIPSGDGWVGCGDGFVTYPVLASHVTRVEQGLWPTASDVVRLAAPRLARGEGCDAALAAPLYVRDKVALTTAERLARGGSK